MDYDSVKIYEERPVEADILVNLLIMCGCIDLPITLMLLIPTLKLLKRKTSPNMKIALGIFVLDFISACSILVMGIFSIVGGYYLPNHPVLCDFNSLFYVGCVCLSSWFVGLMSLERGLLMINNIGLSNKTWIVIMFLECIYFIGCNLVTIGLGTMELMTLAVYCLGSPESKFGYFTLVSYAVMMWFNMIVTVYSYVGIAMIQRQRAFREIRELHSDRQKTLQECNKIVCKVLLSLCLYLLGNFFEFVNTTRELITGIPRTALCDLISTNLVNMNPVINSLLLLHFQEPVRDSFLKMFPCFGRFFPNSFVLAVNQTQN